MNARSPLAVAALAFLGVVAACNDTYNPMATQSPRPASRASASGGTGGGGGGGGGLACSNIKTFSVVPGYYPGSKVWGAIWQTVSVAPCDSGVTLKAVLTASQSSTGPNASLLGSANLGPIGAVEFYSTGKGGSGTTWDWEPVELDAQFNVKLDVFDVSGVLLESKSTSVRTPRPK